MREQKVMNWLGICIGMSLIGIAGPPNDAPPVVSSISACCTGNFSIDRIVKAIQLPRSANGVIQLVRVTEQHDLAVSYGAGSHSPYSVYMGICAKETAREYGVALVVQGQYGASVTSWSPRGDKYEERTIWGADPMSLDNETRIVYIASRSTLVEGRQIETPVVWVTTAGPINRVRAVGLTRELKRRFGAHTISMYLGTNPHFWDTSQFPMVVPAFGVAGKSHACEGVKEPRMYCADTGIGEVQCGLRTGDR